MNNVKFFINTVFDRISYMMETMCWPSFIEGILIGVIFHSLYFIIF
jgi:hypothetical protein